MDHNMLVRIGSMNLANPIMVASGTFGDGYAELIDIDSLGAVVTKTVTLSSRVGNPAPRVAETASGMLNSIGLENKGVEDFIKNKLPPLERYRTKLIVSISGDDEKEFRKLASALNGVKRIDALELNLSCPNIKHGHREGLIAQDEEAVYKVVKAVRSVTDLTIIAKLTPNITDITKPALSAEAAGADAVLIANTYLGMAVDAKTRRPVLGNIVGGLSGPAIKPIALRMVWQAYQKLKIPIIGCGGIMNSNDAIEFILCGAQAVQVGTANFVNPNACKEILAGLAKHLKDHTIKDINELKGALMIDKKGA